MWISKEQPVLFFLNGCCLWWGEISYGTYNTTVHGTFSFRYYKTILIHTPSFFFFYYYDLNVRSTNFIDGLIFRIESGLTLWRCRVSRWIKKKKQQICQDLISWKIGKLKVKNKPTFFKINNIKLYDSLYNEYKTFYKATILLLLKTSLYEDNILLWTRSQNNILTQNTLYIETIFFTFTSIHFESCQRLFHIIKTEFRYSKELYLAFDVIPDWCQEKFIVFCSIHCIYKFIAKFIVISICSINIFLQIYFLNKII